MPFEGTDTSPDPSLPNGQGGFGRHDHTRALVAALLGASRLRQHRLFTGRGHSVMVRLSQLLELDVRQALQFQGIIVPDPLPVVLASSGLRVATAALTTAGCPDGRPRAGDVGATAGGHQNTPIARPQIADTANPGQGFPGPPTFDNTSNTRYS